MIAVRDLQIGDFINTENNGVVQITVLSWRGVGYEGGASTPEHCSYIPLTEEILVKNGFRIQVTDDNSKWLWVTDNSWLAYSERHNYWYYEDMKITYVHQLQHLMRLCGIEKELVID